MSFNTEKGASEYLFVLGGADCCVVITACRYAVVYFSVLCSLVLLCCRRASHVLVVVCQNANHPVNSVYDGPELNVLKTWSW